MQLYGSQALNDTTEIGGNYTKNFDTKYWNANINGNKQISQHTNINASFSTNEQKNITKNMGVTYRKNANNYAQANISHNTENETFFTINAGKSLNNNTNISFNASADNLKNRSTSISSFTDYNTESLSKLQTEMQQMLPKLKKLQKQFEVLNLQQKLDVVKKRKIQTKEQLQSVTKQLIDTTNKFQALQYKYNKLRNSPNSLKNTFSYNKNNQQNQFSIETERQKPGTKFSAKFTKNDKDFQQIEVGLEKELPHDMFSKTKYLKNNQYRQLSQSFGKNFNDSLKMSVTLKDSTFNNSLSIDATKKWGKSQNLAVNLFQALPKDSTPKNSGFSIKYTFRNLPKRPHNKKFKLELEQADKNIKKFTEKINELAETQVKK